MASASCTVFLHSLLYTGGHLYYSYPVYRLGPRVGLSITDCFVFSRPGILVLINDADWELEGEEAYEIKSGDNILFVSTLHGG